MSIRPLGSVRSELPAPAAALAPFDLFLFTTQPAAAATAVRAGVDGLVVDWETRGKHARQADARTEINSGTQQDLRDVKAAVAAPAICRINPFGSHTVSEVESAIIGGADEILLPMVRGPREVERTLQLVEGRCELGILVETEDAVGCSADLGSLPISRAYVGLNDLAIDRGARSIFAAVADGTVERVREAFEVPFGFAGLTLPHLGHPVPCRLLIMEMVRLGCSFSFLRRSYRRDVGATEFAQRAAIKRIRRALADAGRRSPTEMRDARDEIARICGLRAARDDQGRALP